MYLPQGTVLNNRYEVEKVLGHGGFGITYAAQDLTLKVRVAVKEYLPRQLATRGEGQTRVSIFTGDAAQQYDYGLRKFLEEAQSVARFAHHPNVVSARDYFTANGTAYMVMEYVEGVTLKEYLANKGGRISFEEARSILMPVMDALREVHQAGMLHRDVSPDNIYITTTSQVKILDFGAARYFAGEQSKSLSVILKSGYAPEEQYRSKGQQGPWTDVYGTGATLYRALTGQTPPEALDRMADDTLTPPSRLGVAMPTMAEQALLQALAVSASQRFQSLGEFQQALLGNAAVTRGFQPAAASFQPSPGPSYPPGAAQVSTPPQPEVYPQPAPPPSHYPQTPRRSANPAAIAAGLGAGFLGLVLLVALVWKIVDRPPQPSVVKPSGLAVQPPAIPQPVPLPVREEFPRKWLLDWQFQQLFKGYMIITGQSGATNYTGKLFSKSGRPQQVSLDVTITINGDQVFIHSSNPNVPGWNNDDFFLELKGAVMSGYSTDKTGRRGKAFFQGVNETQFEAYLQHEFSPAALMSKSPEPPVPPVVKPSVPPAPPPLAGDPLSRFQVGRQWSLDWQSQFKYRGLMQIQQQMEANRYLTRITVTFSSDQGKEITVSMDGLLTIQGKDVVIMCSNASKSWWDTDNFYLEWRDDAMTGYNIDKKGRRGSAVFRSVGAFSSAAPAPSKPVVPPVNRDFHRRWRVEWRGGRTKLLYSGLLEVNRKINDETYAGSLLIKTPQGDEVSQDARVSLNQSKVEIKCSNPSKLKYPADNFFLQLSGNTMKGYDRDVQGNLGLGVIFTAVN
jgi:serine/threonine protein kinase